MKTHRTTVAEPRGRRPPSRPARPRRPSSINTNAGRSHSPGRPMRPTSGTWCSTTSSARRSPTRASGSRPWPWALRDLLSQRWLKTDEAYDRANPKQVYYLSMEFLIGRSLTNNVLNLRVEPVAQGVRRSARASTGRSSPRRSPTPAWATAAWAGSPPASSTRWPRCSSPRSATACGTSTGSSARRSPTAARSSTRTTGSAVPTPGRSAARAEAVEVGAELRLPVEGRAARGRPGRADDPRAACPTTGRSSATAAGRSTRCGSGARRRTATSTSASSAAATSSTPSTRRSPPSRSPASSIPTTRRPAARACGSSRSISWSPARWPISSRGSAAGATTGTRCPTRSRSSSTTPTRRWPSPS